MCLSEEFIIITSNTSIFSSVEPYTEHWPQEHTISVSHAHTNNTKLASPSAHGNLAVAEVYRVIQVIQVHMHMEYCNCESLQKMHAHGKYAKYRPLNIN